MAKWTKQDKKDFAKKWLEFVITNFFLSIFPLGFVVWAWHFSGSKILNHEYIPDLIMVAFAVCVNIFNMAWDKKKDGHLESLFSIFSIVFLLICVAVYYYTIGVMAELSEQLEKFSIIYDEHPEQLQQSAQDLKNFLENRLDKFRWNELVACSIVILGICVVFGTIMVVRNFHLQSKDSIKLPDDLSDLLENAEKNLINTEYEALVYKVKLDHQKLRKEIEEYRLNVLEKGLPSDSGEEGND